MQIHKMQSSGLHAFVNLSPFETIGLNDAKNFTFCCDTPLSLPLFPYIPYICQPFCRCCVFQINDDGGVGKLKSGKGHTKYSEDIFLGACIQVVGLQI
jgi:hypothetical protein